MKHVKATRWASIVNEMEQQTCTQEMVRGGGPSRHAATTQDTTQHAGGGDAQTETSAQALRHVPF